MRAFLREALGGMPRADAWFRRTIWSRIHFPEHELRVLNALAPDSIDVAVDVGAAMGSYLWVLERASLRVIAYEPGEAHSAYLEAVIDDPALTLVRAAVGETPGNLEMFTPGENNDARHEATLSRDNPAAGASGVRVRMVPVVTLDADLPGRIGDGSVDLIKIDVEGFENAVLAGAAAIIARHHPLLIAEIEARHNPRYSEVFASLRSIGYEVFYAVDGTYQRLTGNQIEALQTSTALAVRLSPGHDARQNRYINNFVFQHPRTRIKLI